MYKDATYKQKFVDLQQWIPCMVESIKKDLRNEHLKKDVYFVKKFFSSKNINKITTEEMATAYTEAMQKEENGEEIAEFIASRWLLNHGELYEFFEQELSKINPDFTSLEKIEAPKAQAMIEASIQAHGALHTYLFSVLNSVVFPDESFQFLKTQAKEHHHKQINEKQQEQEQLTVDNMRKSFERDNARLVDKYEKKLSGLQKKYVTDVETLKKQIAQLHRKLQEKAS